MADVIGERVAKRIEDLRTSQSEVARASRMTQPSIARLISGETRETGKLLELARALQTTPEYLVGETDDPGPFDRQLGVPASPIPPNRKGSDEVEIVQIDLRFGLGATYLDHHVEEKTRSFSRAWLRQFTDAPPENLRWGQGQGNSMAPTIEDGEVILFDLGQQSLTMSDLIWVCAYGEVGMIKRLRPHPDGSVEILSDNANVSPARAVDGELHVIGRVVAVVKRL